MGATRGLTAETAKSFMQRCIWITEVYGVKTRRHSYDFHGHHTDEVYKNGWKVRQDGELVHISATKRTTDGVVTMDGFEEECFGNLNEYNNKEVEHLIDVYENSQSWSWQDFVI